MRQIFLLTLIFCCVVTTLNAQVMDMRALTRQRGYSSYQVHQPIQKPKKVYKPVPKEKKAIAKVKVEVDTQNSEVQQRRDNLSQQLNVPVSNPSNSDETRDYIYNNPHVMPDL